MNPNGPPTVQPSIWRDGRARRNRFWHRRRQRLHERHPRRQRRLRRRRHRWRHRGLRRSPAQLAGTNAVGDPARSARRRRRRHQQGQHRIAAHRVRRHRRARWSRGWSRAGTTCSATTRSRPASRSSAPGRSWWPGPTRNATRCRLEGQGRSATATTSARSSTADEVYRRVPDLGPGALGGLTVPGESIICTWTTNLALATDAVLRGVTTAARRAGSRGAADRQRDTPRCAPPAEMCTAAGSSTPRAWAPITSTPNSAITGSPSRRAAVNSSCSTSSPGRWCR